MKKIYQALALIKKRPEVVWLPLLAIVFFLSASSYNFKVQSGNIIKWTSPDETANYQSAKQLALTSRFGFIESDNIIAQGIIGPRSFRADGAFLKPVSFLGIMFYYGLLAKIFGVASLPYITPAIAAFGIIFFFLLVEKMFDRRTACLAALLLACFPVYLYFSAHSFFHNVPFVVFVLISIYFSLLMLNKERGFWYIKGEYWNFILASLAGLFFGLAVAFRTSELLWLLPVFVVLAIFNWRKLGIAKLILFIYFALVAYSPIMYQNTLLYGAPFSSGYPSMDSSVSNIVTSGTGAVSSTFLKPNIQTVKAYAQNLKSAIFVFGFKPDHSQKMFTNYIWLMFPWLLLLAIFGVVKIFFNGKKQISANLLYLLAGVIASSILIFYYGSWIFYDNPDPNAFTIGNSYTRYWLPIYFLLIPLAASAIVSLTKVLIKPKLVLAGQILIVIFVAFWSIRFVAIGSEEGLYYGYQRQVAAKQELAQILELTEKNSIIITRYHDKLLFPERRVIVGLLTDTNMNEIYAKLAKYNQLYYYNFKFSEADLAYLNKSKLKEVGLKIEKIAQVTKDFSLYKLSLRP